LEKSSADPINSFEFKITQPENGYRFSMDPFLLAVHALSNITLSSNIKKIIDVGCGCGIISVLLADCKYDLKITGIEIQDDLFHHAVSNVATNNLQDKIDIIHGDIYGLTCEDINGPIDMIVSNPPYKKINSGRKSHNLQKNIARHEISLNMEGIFKCSKILLNKQGSLHLIYPAERLCELVTTANKFSFTPSVIRFVHIKKNQNAKFVLFSAIKEGSNKMPLIPSPLYIYSPDNSYSDEYISMFSTWHNRF
jgi:tRNA1Val (adenine37-N6)-methyltransferase